MSGKPHSPLLIPALRALMGSWGYYVGVMQMKDIAERVSIVEDIHPSEKLQDFLQRQLSQRSKAISDYLLNQEQRFFNSLVIGTYGGQPQWLELGVKAKDAQQEERLQGIEGIVGFLELSGAETLFAIDGQHRVAGIKGAIQKNKDLESEEVSVIFVAGVTQSQRAKDPQGFERTRRLFTTLNRYAKPVGKRDIIALDEDDAVAILTRKMIDEYLPFKEKISSKGSNSVPKTDRVSLTTITNLYDILDIYLGDDVGARPSRRIRPSEAILQDLYIKSIVLFDELGEAFPPLLELYQSEPAEKTASKYRHSEGGLLLFRPIGLKMIVTNVVDLCRQGFSINESLSRLGRAELDLSKVSWAGLIWNTSSRRMITASENQKAARLLLLYSVGGSLEEVGSHAEKLKTELSGLLNRSIKEITLPKYV
jgi:DNA sulfur modification protein DndB